MKNKNSTEKVHICSEDLYSESICISHEDLFIMLSFSLRYSMGRRTYVVSEICNLIKKYKNFLNKDEISILERDLSEELSRRQLGDECDHKEWTFLLDFLKENK